MEDVIEVYHRPFDPECPAVCVDEAGKQLIGEVRPPLSVRVGSSAPLLVRVGVPPRAGGLPATRRPAPQVGTCDRG
jgi:hypothetical protein